MILDLKRDEYLALEAPAVGSLYGYIEGWPAAHSTAATFPAKTAAEIAEMLSELSSKGLISAKDPAGQPYKAPQIASPADSLIGHDGPIFSRVRARHVFAFLGAALVARLILCLRSSGSLLWLSQRWEQRRRSGAAAIPVERFQSHIGAFNRLSPLLLNKKNNCLIESLALANYLSCFGFVPNCVVGIRTRPFTAHCWVQYGATVLNDSCEYTASLTPILVL